MKKNKNKTVQPSTPVQLVTSLAAAFLCIVFLTCSIAQAAGQNTAFLPLSIISPQPDDSFTTRVDSSLETVLAKENLSMIDRATASRLVNYDSWPPSSKLLNSLAEETGMDNVAVGTLTIIGNQISIDFKVFDVLDPTHPKYFFREASSIASVDMVIADIIGDVENYLKRDQYIASIAPAGNKRIDSGAILRKIRTKAGDFYNPAVLREDLKAIYKMGFFNDVQIDVSDTKEGKMVIFNITEKPAVSSITYSGLDELKEEDVAEVVNIKENSILNPARVNSATEAIKVLYKSKGYYNTEVKQETSYPTADSAAIRFVIDEGKKIFIKEIGFEGNAAFDTDDLEDVIETSEKQLDMMTVSDGLSLRKLVTGAKTSEPKK
jgi:outer membrane protein insertion porin family